MRTKTLLLIAAVGAAGVGSTMAQVYSVNAVGYVNTTIPAGGYALISNPLIAATNTIAALFAGVNDGTKVFVYNKGYTVYQYDALGGAFAPDATTAAATIMPGQGVFVQNPDKVNPMTVTFVGEVPQGTLTTAVVPGYQIISSQVPQAGDIATLGYVPNDGDKVFQFTAAQSYYVSQFDALSGTWSPALQPLAVGEAVFLETTTAGSWTRTFNVNQ